MNITADQITRALMQQHGLPQHEARYRAEACMEQRRIRAVAQRDTAPLPKLRSAAPVAMAADGVAVLSTSELAAKIAKVRRCSLADAQLVAVKMRDQHTDSVVTCSDGPKQEVTVTLSAQSKLALTDVPARARQIAAEKRIALGPAQILALRERDEVRAWMRESLASVAA